MKSMRIRAFAAVMAFLLSASMLGANVCLAQSTRCLTSRDALATVAVLNEAWNLENNAALRSDAYAASADREGYGPLASLFRAAAQSQRVHARNLATALRKLGWQPVLVSEKLEVGSTTDNLRTEIALHSVYRDAAFPRFESALQREHFRAALSSVKEARQSEASLVTYFKDAADNLSSSRKLAKATYYVCKECGYMTMSVNFHVCKVCYHFREKHEAVS